MRKWQGLTAALAVAGLAFGEHSGTRQNPSGKNLERLQFNNPEAVVPLHHSVFGGFFVGDWDQDGRPDICVYNWSGEADWCWSGIKIYHSSKGKVREDGTIVYSRGEWTKSLPKDRERGPWCGRWPGAKELDLKTVHRAPVSKDYGGADYSHCIGDLNGDGFNDCLVFANDRSAYGWHDNYNENGVWLTPHKCFAYVMWGKKSTKENPADYRDPQPLYNANGQPMLPIGQVKPRLIDLDGDGDLDLFTAEAPDLFLYRENVGTKSAPKFALPRDLADGQGRRISTHLCFADYTFYDYDGDGLKDLMAIDEESGVCWFKSRGVRNGAPVFDQGVTLLQAADELYYGDMSTPFAADFDGDGDEDILTGNAAGDVAIIYNLSGRGVEFPKWSVPMAVKTPDGKPLNVRAGVNGSIQGPQEAKYGYTITTVADWDGDGKLDILMNTIWGKILWCKNIGSKKKPRFDYPKGIEVEWEGEQPALKWGWFKPKTQANPKEIITQWRTTPWPVDLNGDGLVDLVLCDTDGDFAFWERYRDKKGALRLKPPRKALCTADGKPLRAARWLADSEWLKGWGGASGRRKLAMADWDGDGKLDIIVNYGANCQLWRQLRAEGGKWYFEVVPGTMAKEPLWSHDPVPGVCDFNADGKPDLLFGAMDGHIYYMRNPRTK